MGRKSLLDWRNFKVRRDLTPEQAVAATGITDDMPGFIDWDVVRAMPQGRGTEMTMFIFEKPYLENDEIDANDSDVGQQELEGLYERYRLIPVDPYAVLGLYALNPGNEGRVDDPSIFTWWRDRDGHLCYLGCGVCHGNRTLQAGRKKCYTYPNWWSFGGIQG